MSRDVKRTKSTGNVFRDLGYPEPEARNLTLRSDLFIAIEKLAKDSSLTQTAAAKQLGMTQSRLNQLLGVRNMGSSGTWGHIRNMGSPEHGVRSRIVASVLG